MSENQSVNQVLDSVSNMPGDAGMFTPDSGVRLEKFPSGAAIPLILRAEGAGIDLVAWARANRGRIDALLLEHRALLFRGFKVGSPDVLRAFAEATSNGPMLEYKDRSTPRYEVGKGIYVSTIYPADQRIQPHNEGTYWKTWPLKIYFCALKTPAEGGETPIADVRQVYARIDPAIRELFREKQIMYVRNYNPGVGLTWQDAFQTDDPKVVAEYAAKNGIHIEWTKSNRLRTRQIRPAIRPHPITGEDLWFNHGAFFHVSSLDPEVQDALLSSYKEEGLPFNTYLGDGARIDPAMVANINAAYTGAKTMFRWIENDIMLLDNMTITHAREPYVGDRNIVVAMTEAQSDEVV